MPTYEYRCRACGRTFETFMSINEHERQKREGIACPHCGKRDVVQQFTAIAVHTSRKS